MRSVRVRFRVVLVGVLLLVVGLALWYLPLPGPNGSNAVPDGSAAIVPSTTPLALLSSSLPWTASWTSASSVNVTAYDCGTSSNTCTQAVTLQGIPIVASGTGSSGSLSWSGPRGEVYAIAVTSLTGVGATVTWGYSVPLGGGSVGLGLTGIGVVVILVGAAQKARPTGPPSAPAPKAPDP
jgi:hypothetical protein